MAYINNINKKPRAGAYSEYVYNKQQYSRHTLRIKPTGECVYLMGDKEVPESDFKKMFPIGLIDKSRYGNRLDSKQRIF